MKTRWFIVVNSMDSWWVDCEGQSYGPFPGQAEAEDAARWLAKAIGDPVREMRVYAPDARGEPQMIWASTWPDEAAEDAQPEPLVRRKS
jgi:hypothetical protein